MPSILILSLLLPPWNPLMHTLPASTPAGCFPCMEYSSYWSYSKIVSLQLPWSHPCPIHSLFSSLFLLLPPWNPLMHTLPASTPAGCFPCMEYSSYWSYSKIVSLQLPWSHPCPIHSLFSSLFTTHHQPEIALFFPLLSSFPLFFIRVSALRARDLF